MNKVGRLGERGGKGEGRREKGEGRREQGEGRREEVVVEGDFGGHLRAGLQREVTLKEW